MIFSMLNVVEAWNEISWADAIPFTLVLIGLYWVKVKIDTSAGLGRKKSRQLKKIIVEAIKEANVSS
tara:strand:+ start:1111 stop:1311 length:201 start_codon:yes stop_codon:yes gene_type:complete